MSTSNATTMATMLAIERRVRTFTVDPREPILPD
jgi:hypothetical protein